MAKRVVPIKPDEKRTIAALMGPQRVAALPVEVVASTPGPVTFRQKAAGYYKGIVAFIGTLLTLATAPEIGPLQHLLPAEYQHWLTIGIGVVTVLLTFLKENQHWISDPAGQD